jgi:hypothetical protein
MMLIRRAAIAALVLAITAAGCSGNGASAPQPLGVAQPGTNGTATLGATTNPTEALPSSGDAGTVTYPTGSGTVSASDSTSAPTGTTALTSQARAAASKTVTPQDATTPQTPALYLSYTAQTTSTLNGIPGVSVTLATAPPAGGVYEAYWNGTTWVAFGAPPAGVNGAVVTFGVTTKPVTTLAAGGVLNVVIYYGAPLAAPTASPSPSPTPTAVPTATPTPSPSPTPTAVPTATPVGATPTPTPTPVANVIADGGFETPTVAAVGSAVTSTGWTQCTIPFANIPTSGTPVVQGTGDTATAPHPGTSFTPVPGATPAAVIEASGTSIQQGSASPIATTNNVVVNSGTYAAVFGQLFSNYNAGDYRYNGLCQQVTVPANSSLAFSVYGAGNETSLYVDFDAILLNSDGTWNSWLYDESVDNDSAYRSVSVPMPSATVGNTYTLFMGMWTKSGSNSGSMLYSGYYFLDDVSLQSTLSGVSTKRAPLTAPAARKK